MLRKPRGGGVKEEVGVVKIQFETTKGVEVWKEIKKKDDDKGGVLNHKMRLRTV